MGTYEQRELNATFARIQSRNKLGAYWREDSEVDPHTCIERISWLLDGSYGFGEMLYAKKLIANRTEGKTGKSLINAYKACGRDLVLLVALFDTTDITFRKITEVWKQKGFDFEALNVLASKELQSILGDK